MLSSLLTFTLFRFIFVFPSKAQMSCKITPVLSVEKTNFLLFLDNAIMNSAAILVKVGGYIILFSILANHIMSIPFLPLHIKSFLAAVFELTIGTYSISTLPSFSYETKTALILSLTSFGGLSALLQTKSVILSSRLSIKRYFFGKCISALLTYLMVLLSFYF